VVGSVAGIAVLLAVALFVLRWKKRQHNGIRLGEDPSSTRALPAAGGASANRRSMAERFAVPATLAALAGKRPEEQQPSSGERSFYRVSGRKLPSVFAHGGDGFGDPMQRASVATTVDMFNPTGQPRDSTGPRFALGSPMRPESGVVVYRDGPARTPVHTPLSEQGPFQFSDRNIDLELTPPGRHRDAVGRSLVSSSGSGSRFTENIE
jgi:hypothetical protein